MPAFRRLNCEAFRSCAITNGIDPVLSFITLGFSMLPLTSFSLKKPQKTALYLAMALTCTSLHSYAISYGIYDSRGLGMGGAAAAIGSHAQAAFYNPALLAFHDKEEEQSRDGRVYFPNLVVQLSGATEEAIEALDDELDNQISDAIDAFNLDTSAANAGVIVGHSRELRDLLDDIDREDLGVDSFVGFIISEPSNREGGAFYFGARAIGVGAATISDADSALLDDYIDALSQVASGTDFATVAAQYPNLVDNGNLLDPTDTLTSTADVSGLAIAEWGMAMAKEWEFWGQGVSFGITPKLMRVDAYRDTADFNSDADNLEEGTDSLSDTKDTHITFNADLGIAATIAEHYRVSIAIKDVFEKSFSTTQEPDPITGITPPELTVTLSPRSRMGLGYINNNFTLGVDYDLQEAEPMANEATTQELALGAEYVLWNSLALRAGYRQDQAGLRDDVMSGGIGYRWHRFVIDAAYAQGGDGRAAGLQLGWTF